MKKFLPVLFLWLPFFAHAQQPLLIPDTLSGTAINLIMHKDSMQILPGVKTGTMAFNAFNYLGPTLILQKNSIVNMHVQNGIGDTTSVHWHGLHVAPTNDGGPHTAILPAAAWSPSFKVMNNAATYWYHPHIHMKTAQQVMLGAAGLIIVRDSAEALLNLPRTYGVDDIPLIVQSQQLDTLNQIDTRGMVDSILLVNGTFDPYAPLPAQVVRLRLLNAAGERNFNFGFTGNKTFYVIGNDDGLLSAPVATTRIKLSPGERAEVLLDLTGMNGQIIYLMSYASELPMGVQGGPTMPMPVGSPPMNSSLNGIDFNILKFNVGLPTTSPVTSIPTSLVPVTPYPENSATTTRDIHFTADSFMVMDGPFYFNDSTFDMMHINYRIPLNSTEIWKFINETMVAHPFHIHDVHFFILDRNGIPPSAKESGPKDVVLVEPGDTVRVIMRFEDFADTATPYMYHCHILMHEDDGMMGQFVVTPNTTGVSKLNKDDNRVSVFPNPANNNLNVQIANFIQGTKARVSVTDLAGRTIFESEISGSKLSIATQNWSDGMYLLTVSDHEFRSVHKISIQKQ
jgi:blue copper oxidase